MVSRLFGPVPTPQMNFVPPASIAPNKLSPGSRTMRQLAKDREREGFVLPCFQHHENRHSKEDQLHNAINLEMGKRYEVESGPQNPIRNQPRDKQVQALEGVEAYRRVAAKTRRCKHYDRDNPANSGNITQYGCRSRMQCRKRLGWRRRRTRGLPRAALCTKDIRAAHFISALAAKGHS